MKTAPRLPPNEPDDGSGWESWCPVLSSNTRCKHGEQDCAVCGTSSRRDELHQTRNGLGSIAQVAARYDRRGNRRGK